MPSLPAVTPKYSTSGERSGRVMVLGKAVWLQTQMCTLKSDSGSPPGFPHQDRPSGPAALEQRAYSNPRLTDGRTRGSHGHSPVVQLRTGSQVCLGVSLSHGGHTQARFSLLPPLALHSSRCLFPAPPSGFLGPTALIPPVQRSTHYLSTRVPVCLLPG